MTICVAAICANTTVIGAADRMITAGDTEFQQGTSKIWEFSNSIIGMIAGDTSLQARIYYAVHNTVAERIRTNPEIWWTVSDIVDLYTLKYAQLRNEMASMSILSPLGLTIDNYLLSSLAEKLATELLNYRMQEFSVIIAGIDPSGPHIYTVSNLYSNAAEVICHDMTGFACIGSGHWHAKSQFMFAGHSREVLQTKALATAYSAKKRAEVAPGIGDSTDMFVIGTQMGTFTRIASTIIDDLDKMYKRYETQGRKILGRLESEVESYVTNNASKAQSEQTAKRNDGGPTSTNGETTPETTPRG